MVVTFHSSVVSNALVVDLSCLLQAFADHSLHFFLRDWSHNVLHKNLRINRRPNTFSVAAHVLWDCLTKDFLSIHFLGTHPFYHLQKGIYRKQWFLYPLQQRQSGFQCSFRATKRKTIPRWKPKLQWAELQVPHFLDRKPKYEQEDVY